MNNSLSIDKIWVENFQCYDDSMINFNLSHSISIYGRNGSGKSTILRAIASSLFQNKHLRKTNLKISDLIKEGKDSGSVKIKFKINNKFFTIKWEISSSDGTKNCYLEGDNDLYIEGQQNVRNFLEKNQNLQYNTYRTSYIKQGETRMMSEFDSEKRLEILDEFIGLNKVDNYIENLKYSRREIKSNKKQIKGSMNEIKKQIENSERKEIDVESLEDRKQKKEKEISEKSSKIKKLEKEKINIESKIDQIKNTETVEIEKEFNDKVNKNKEKAEELKNKRKKVENKIDNIKNKKQKQEDIYIESYSGDTIIEYKNREYNIKNIELPSLDPNNIKETNFGRIIEMLNKRLKEKINTKNSKEDKKINLKEEKNQKQNKLEQNKKQKDKLSTKKQEKEDKILEKIEEIKNSRNLLEKLFLYLKQKLSKNNTQQLDKIREKIKGNKNKIDSNKIPDKYEQIKIMTNELNEIKIKINKKDKKLKKLRQSLRENSNRRNQIDKQQEEIEKKINVLEEIISITNDWQDIYFEYKELDNKKEQLNSEIREMNSIIEESENLINEKNKIKENNNIEKDENQLKKELENIIKRKKELENEKEKLEDEVKNIETKISQFNNNKNALEKQVKRKEKLEEKLNKLNQFKNEVNTVIERCNEYKSEKRKNAISNIQRISNLLFKKIYKDNNYEKIVISNSFEIYMKKTNGNETRLVQLSGGEKTITSICIRCSIYKTFADSFEEKTITPLILDEPTYNLDENHKIEITNFIEELKKWSEQIIVVTHDENTIPKMNKNINAEKLN